MTNLRYISLIAFSGILLYAIEIFPQEAKSNTLNDKNIQDTAAKSGYSQSAPYNEDFPVFYSGDAIGVSMYPDTAGFANRVYPIDDQGYVNFPILGQVQVTNMTKKQVEEMLKSAYIQFTPYPNIQVRPMMRVILQGGFLRPGFYWVEPTNSMWNVLQLAGGTQFEESLKNLRWERNRMIISKDVIPYIESGKSLKNLGFRSGDQLYVTQQPKRSFIDVLTQQILPVITFSLTTVSTAATVYISYQTFKQRP